MASRKAFSIENPDAMADALRGLEATFSESTLRKAGATGATVFKDEVAARVPRGTGDLAKGLTVAYAPEDSVPGKIATYIVTFVGTAPPLPSGKPGMRRRDVANWLENGTSERAAHPFVRPAYEAVKSEAANKANETLTEQLAKGGR